MTRLATACPKPRQRSKSKTRVKRVNHARQKREFVRTLHSKARQKFVASLPCAACGIVGFSQNAHLLGVDGARLKGSYLEVGPLCGARYSEIGCHRLYDEFPWCFVLEHPDFNPGNVAAATERAWQSASAQERSDEQTPPRSQHTLEQQRRKDPTTFHKVGGD